MIHNVDYHITDKCNLHCASCNHFCPLVPKEIEHKSLKQIEKDLTILSKFKNEIEAITIMGGEPTIHPDFVQILYLTRKLFPDNKLIFTTNCINSDLILSIQKDIVDTNFLINLSKYPVDKSVDGFNKIKEQYQNINRINETHDCSWFLKSPLTLTRQNDDEDILNCRMRGYCCQLKDEHLYICNLAAQINYVYDAFPFTKNYINTEGYEKVDLNTATADDIHNLAYYNIPAFCFYCHECKRQFKETFDENVKTSIAYCFEDFEYNEWAKSKKSVDEWIR